MPTPEFAFLNDQAVKITSLRQGQDGEWTLVVIARGGADRDRTLELLADSRLQVRFGEGERTTMRATDIDVRSAGEGPQAIHRIETTLTPAPEAPEPASDPIVERLDRIIALLEEIRDRQGDERHR